MSRVEIKPACLRDASYILGNLNAADSEEVLCLLPDGVAPYHLAPMHVSAARSHIAYVDDLPAMFFGLGMLSAACASVWAMGTRHSWRAVPAVTRFWRAELVPWMLESGYRSAEARTLMDHTTAHRWMRQLGGAPVAELHGFGKNGETFILMRFTVSSYRKACQET